MMSGPEDVFDRILKVTQTIIQSGSLALAAAALWYAKKSLETQYTSLRTSVSSLLTQTKLQNFSNYTKRYQEIIANLPVDVDDDNFNIDREEFTGDRNSFMRTMRIYFDMCFEEFWLFRKGYIDEEIWNVWESGIRTAMSRPAFRQAWNSIGNNSNFGEEFHRFLDKKAGVTTTPRR